MLQIARFSVVFALLGAIAFAACGDNGGQDHDAFDTYQMCWDEHHTTEMFTVQQAITICCLSHPIGTQPMNVVCGGTAASCETYVGSSLGSADAGSADITAGCTDYITQRGM
ncbi:MAG TPA: hypothetical protein VFQ65_25315 [Kofleriaceae bacterium]|nr:hypothetical protein [Kofleriaceae bacterium]